ncbi:MAG: glycosyltransferase, partial [Candidatus Thiodiazotropha sp. 6PLUC3]
MLISLIVPIYNEHSGLVQFWQSLEKSVAPCDTEFEAVLIDDGSTDSTWEAIETLSSSSQIPIKAIRLSRNFGKEAAILAGLRG